MDIDGVLNKNSTKEMFGPYTGIDESLVQNFKRILAETRPSWVDGLSVEIAQQVIDYLNDVDTDL